MYVEERHAQGDISPKVKMIFPNIYGVISVVKSKVAFRIKTVGTKLQILQILTWDLNALHVYIYINTYRDCVWSKDPVLILSQSVNSASLIRRKKVSRTKKIVFWLRQEP